MCIAESQSRISGWLNLVALMVNRIMAWSDWMRFLELA